MKIVRLLYNNFKLSLLNEMAHKANFVMRFVADSIYFLVYFVFYTVVFSYVPNINGWGKYDVLILMGTFHIVISFFLAFFFPNLIQIPNLVKSGGLDTILIKPINSQLLLSTKMFDFGSLLNVCLGIAIVIFSISQIGLKIKIQTFLAYIFFIFVGVSIVYFMLFILLSTIFWLQDSSWCIGFIMTFNSFADKPFSIYKGIIYRFLIFIFPIGLVANIPASIILHKETYFLEIWIIVAALILGLLANYIWKKGITVYEGASI